MRLLARPALDLPVIEAYGIQELLCDGTIASIDGEIVHILVYIERRVGEATERQEIARFCMSRSRYESNLLRAFERFSRNDPAGACHRCLVRGSEREH